MKLLIIGGCGYVGSAIGKHLADKHEITNIDLEWFGNFAVTENINMDYDDLTPKFLKDFDAVILLAGHSSVKMCEEDLLSSYNNNVRNFINLLGKLDKQKFLYASSASVYGDNSDSSINELSNTQTPINYYDMGKLHIDHIASLSTKEYYGLRFGTVNGVGPTIRTDLMINAMTYSALTDKIINVNNGSTVRSILGLKDLCRAVETILDSESNPGIYNLSSFTTTAIEVARDVSDITGASINDMGDTLKNKYNFDMDTTKFCETFNFEFKETARTIAQDLTDKFKEYDKSNRSESIHYT